MLIHTSIEQRRRVFSNRTLDQALPTWVFIHKGPDIVNDTSNHNKGFEFFFAHVLEVGPVDDGQFGKWQTPVQALALLVESLLLLLQAAFLNLVGAEGFETVCEMEGRQGE